MNGKPMSPYKYHIAVGKNYRVHQLREDVADKEAWCGKTDKKWFDQWITQEQLEAIPCESWCPKCLEAIS